MVNGVRSSLLELEAEIMRTGPGDGRWGRTSTPPVELVLAGSGEKLPGALCVGPGVPLPLVGCIVYCCWSSRWWCFVMDHT